MTASGVQALVVLLCSGACAGLAAFVWSRRQGATGGALALLLLALCAWNLAYGGELLADGAGARVTWGDLKYVGICALTPAWTFFVLLYTGRVRRVSRRLLLVLTVEPVAVLVLLAVPATHDLVRHLSDDPADPVAAGPLFWVHLAWTDAILLPVTALLVVSLVRRSSAYWLQAAALVVAALLPWVANLLFNLQVGVFASLDLTPVVFTVSAAVLAWGLFQQRLLRLRPLARSLLVERMTDLVLVVDAYGHVVDVNPAARAVLEPAAGPLLGRLVREVLPEALEVLPGTGGAPGDAAREVVLDHTGAAHTYEVADVPLPGRSGPGGRLLVLRDVTARTRLEARLRDLLAEQARVARQLSSSLRPPSCRTRPAWRSPGASGRPVPVRRSAATSTTCSRWTYDGHSPSAT